MCSNNTMPLFTTMPISTRMPIIAMIVNVVPVSANSQNTPSIENTMLLTIALGISSDSNSAAITRYTMNNAIRVLKPICAPASSSCWNEPPKLLR